MSENLSHADLDRRGLIQIGLSAVSLIGLGLSSTALRAQSPSAVMSAAEWKIVVDSAQKDGHVNAYSMGLPAVNARLTEDFEKAYPGIKADLTRLVGFDLDSRVEQERTSGSDGADVIMSTDVLWLSGLAKAALLTQPSGPAATEWPAHYMVERVVPMLSTEPYAIAYNTNLVKTPISGYGDLVKPEFGHYKMATLGPVAPVALALYDWLTETQGPDFLKKFAALKPNIYPSNGAAAQAVASGEVAIAASSNPSSCTALINQGAPLKVVVPNSTLGFMVCGAILKWSKRPNAALVFMDYLMSRRGQGTWNGIGESASPLKNIPGSLDITGISPWDPSKFPPDTIKADTEKFNTLFMK